MHQAFQAAADDGVAPAEAIIPVWAALEPVVVMLEPHINFLALFSVIAAHSRDTPGDILRALDAGSSQIITAPAFDAQLFSIACRIGANLYDHFHPPAAPKATM